MKKNNLNLAIKLRHDLHRNPELSNKELWTKKYLINFLQKNTDLRIVDRGKWFYAVYKSNIGRRNVAFRTEMDAIKIDEHLTLPYSSKNEGVSHKCGHDGHAATLAAFAIEIDQNGSDNNIFFLFQHAEEIGFGASEAKELIINENIDEIFAYHNMSGMKYQSINVVNNVAHFASKGMNIYMEGIPSHASEPEKGKNPSFAISKLINEIPKLTSEKHNNGLLLCTIIQVNVGEKAYGISASKGYLRLTIRAEFENELDKLQENLEKLSKQQAKKFGLDLNITYNDIFPETYNNKESNDKIRKACQEKGYKLNELKKAFRGSDDFGHYTKLTKGAIFYIGNGKNYPNIHSSEYDFNDNIIEIAVEIFMELASY